jgi:hypothetical protein
VRGLPDVTQFAVLLNGLPTVTFPSFYKPRLITKLFVNSVVNAGVTVYRGAPANAATITSLRLANPATYTSAFKLPGGQNLFVVFTAVASPVNSAFATISALYEE